MKFENKAIVGVDLGGTNMRAGLVKNNAIMKVSSRGVPRTDEAQLVVDHLIATIREVMNDEVEGIGVGVPSLVKAHEGVVYEANNIPSWRKVPLKALLEKEFGLPVYINNDANCYAAGERFFGEGRQYRDFVGLITGTGLGAGIIKEGRLLSDQNCGAGEFGMIPYLDHDYEYYCSGQFFQNTYQMSGEEMAEKARQGDDGALKAFEQYGRHLGKALKMIMFAVDPEAVVIGGSVSKSFELYREAMWEEVKSHPFTVSLENFKVVTSHVKEIAILGAAALYINALK